MLPCTIPITAAVSPTGAPCHSAAMPAPEPVAGPPPDESALRQAALNHLARYSTTQAGLLRVLTRRAERWARAADAPAEALTPVLDACRAVVAKLVELGVVDDAAFAASRARSLVRAGRSRRVISAHLQAKGVPSSLAAIPDDPDTELAAAILYIARRRMGPFAPAPADRQKEFARMARAGFTAGITARALALPLDEAEAMLLDARRL